MKEEVREEHPPGGEWRADALARSRHSRLLDELPPPATALDPRRAVEVCAEVCREALRDFAPTLLLLPERERRRVQALAAYALTLFDFAHQRGVEGERLAQMNRWEYDLDQALGGNPPPQPVFARMADEEAHRPWPRAALARVGGAARRRITHPRPATAEEADRDARELGAALAEAALGSPAPPGIEGLLAGLVRLHGLQNLGEELRQHRSRLPASELPDGWDGDPSRAALERAVGDECTRIRPLLLSAARDIPKLATSCRRAATFLILAAQKLLVAIEQIGPDVVAQPPQLGPFARIALLVRARRLAPRGAAARR